MAATPEKGSIAESSPAVEAIAEAPELVGFQEWKQTRVYRAREAVDLFKTQRLGDPNDVKGAKGSEEGEPTEAKAEKPEVQKAPAVTSEDGERLRQLEFNLEIAQGLTIHDYFALYLKSMDKTQLAQAVQKLSPEELSELLLAYRQKLYGIPIKKAEVQAPVGEKL